MFSTSATTDSDGAGSSSAASSVGGICQLRALAAARAYQDASTSCAAVPSGHLGRGLSAAAAAARMPTSLLGGGAGAPSPARQFSTLSDIWGRFTQKLAPPTPAPVPAPMATVLVKIGSGMDSDFSISWADLKAMPRMALLRALAGDMGFAAKLKGVALDDCKAYVLQTVAGSVPTAAEEAPSNMRELVGTGTVGELLPPNYAGVVFVRVHLPSGLEVSLGEWL